MATLTLATQTYSPKKWNLSGLKGISDKTLEMHFGLYEGYVKNTNLLNEQIAGKIESGHAAATDLEFSELNRRLAFEYNGMRLHELYFNNLTTTSRAARQRIDKRRWREPTATSRRGRKISPRSARCAALAGRSPTKIPLTDASRITGSSCTRTAISPRSPRSSSWTFGNTRSCSTTSPQIAPKYIEAFFTNVDWGTIAAQARAKKRQRNGADDKVSERLRLFPLNTVLFPGATLHLHVFEPRYKQLIAECLDRGEAFGVCLIREGGEAGDPEVNPHEIGTTAEISEVMPLPFGRYYVSTIGKRRFRITDIISREPFLLCDVEYLDEASEAEAPAIESLIDRVRAVVR